MTRRSRVATFGVMVILTLEFATDTPEFSHEEIERQFAELGRELATESPDPR